MIHRLRHHRRAPPLPDMAPARALDLVVLEVLELRPLRQEGLTARVAQPTAVLAEGAVVLVVAGCPAVFDSCCDRDGARGC
jgi:hypothetical protein